MKPLNTSSGLRSLILPIYLPSAIMSLGYGMIILAIPLLAIELTGSYGSASLTFAMLGVGTLLADIPAGILVSRIGVRLAMLMGIITISLATLAAGLFGSVLVLGASGFFLGVGRGLVMLSRMTYIADTTTTERGRAMAAVGGMMRVGMFIGPILGGFTAKFFGLDTTLVLAGLLIISTVGFVVFLSSANSQSSDIHTKNPLKSAGKILVEYRSTFLTAGVAVIGLQLLRSARTLIVPLWGDAIGLDAADIGLITGIPMGLEMTMFYPVGVIMDRFGRKWTAVPCITILSIALALIPLCHSFTPFLLVVLLAGVGNGLGSGIFLTLGADFSPVIGRSEFLGVWRLIGDSGHTASPFLIGLLTEVFTLGSAPIATAGIGLISAMVMLFFVKESKGRY